METEVAKNISKRKMREEEEYAGENSQTSLNRKSSECLWRPYIDDVDVRHINTRRSCEFLFMVEADTAHSEVIEKFKIGSSTGWENPVRSLSLDEVCAICSRFPINECAGFDFGPILRYACGEAFPYIQKGRPIPVELQAQLIKLTSLFMMHRDVVLRRRELESLQETQMEFDKLLQVDEPKKGGKKGDKKGKEKKPKSEKKEKKGKGKSKSSPKMPVDEDPCAFLKPTPAEFTEGQAEPLDVEDKHMYFIINGFYDSRILEELYKIKIPLSCVIEVADLHHKLKDPTRTNDPRLSYEANFSPSTEFGENAFPSSMHWEDKFSREIDIFEFWSKTYKLFEGDVQYAFLENTHHSQYIPRRQKAVCKSTAEYMRQCMQIFSDICDFVQTVPDVRRQHTNYIRNILLTKLGKSQKTDVGTMSTYRSRMDDIPPDCFTINLLMDSLLDEVCENVPDNYIDYGTILVDNIEAFNASSDSDFALDPETFPFPKPKKKRRKNQNETTNDDEEDLCAQEFIPVQPECSIIEDMNILYNQFNPLSTLPLFHQGVRDHVVTVFKKYKKRYVPYAPNNRDTQRIIYSPATLLDLDTKPFLIHDENKMELQFHPYKQIREFLFDLNVEYMKRSPPGMLWNYHQQHTKLEEFMALYQQKMWPNFANISNEDFHDNMNLYFLTKIECYKQKKPPEKQFYDVQKNYPNRRQMCIERDKYPQLTFCGSRIGMGNKFTEINNENMYEGLEVSDFKYKEKLPAPVFLQRVIEEFQNFRCMDYKYCPIVDKLIIRFHDNADEFGCLIDTWSESIRTPVCLRDFCKYIVNEDSGWVEREEERYYYEQYIIHDIVANNFDTFGSYQDLAFREFNYILPGSIKDTVQQKESVQSITAAADKGKSKSKKMDSGSTVKILKEFDPPPSAASNTNNLGYPLTTQIHRCAVKGEPYTFIGYDLGSKRVQLTGVTTTFQSLDGVRATVDTTNFMGHPRKISLNITANDQSLIFHYDAQRSNECMFHYSLSNGTILAFSRPEEKPPTEYKICENTVNTEELPEVKMSNSAVKKRPKLLYYITERHECLLKCFNVPYTAKKSYLLPENEWEKFHAKMKYLGTKSNVHIKLNTDDELINSKASNESKKSQNSAPKAPVEVTPSLSETSDISTPYKKKKVADIKKGTKRRCKKYKKSNITEELDEAQEGSNVSEDGRSESTMDVIEEEKQIDNMEELKKLFLEGLRKAQEDHIPIFKVCTSKLNGYTYIKRVKSYIKVSVKGVVKRVLYKPKIITTKRIIEVKKCFPLDDEGSPKVKVLPYECRISLPSGLHIRTEPGVDGDPYYVKQYYLQKGPQCKITDDEDSRSFLRNGCLVIKKFDGTISVLTMHGQVIKYETPYLPETRTTKPQYKLRNPLLYHEIDEPKDSVTYKKAMKQILQRRIKHLIDGPEANRRKTRRSYRRNLKRYMKPNDMYFTDAFPRYSILTSDGKKIKYICGKVIQEHRYFTCNDNDFEHEETLKEREDGTHTLLARDGTNTVQFPDGTRISSWFVTDGVIADDLGEEEEEIMEEEDDFTGFKQESYDSALDKAQSELLRENKSAIMASDMSFRNEAFQTLSHTGLEGEEEYVDEEEEAQQDSINNLSVESIPVSSKIGSFAKESNNNIENVEHYASNANLTSKRDSGWVFINLFYEFEHPNYATIIYGTLKDNMRIILPDNVILESKGENDFYLDIDKHVFAEMDREKISLNCTMCTNCEEPCVSTIFIGPLYHQEEITYNTMLLKVVDTFDKTFEADYMGVCQRNIDYIRGYVNRIGCDYHKLIDTQKLYSMNRNYSGVFYWNDKMYQEKVTEAEKNFEAVTNQFGPKRTDIEAVEFQCIKEDSPHNKFFLPYTQPKLVLTKDRKDQFVCDKIVSYITHRTLCTMPDYEKIKPLYTIIEKLREARKNFETKDVNINLLISKISQHHLDAIKTSPPETRIDNEHIAFSQGMTEDAENALSLREKWVDWKERCNIYEAEIHNPRMPPYFTSGYAEPFIRSQEPSVISDASTDSIFYRCRPRFEPKELRDVYTSTEEMPFKPPKIKPMRTVARDLEHKRFRAFPAFDPHNATHVTTYEESESSSTTSSSNEDGLKTKQQKATKKVGTGAIRKVRNVSSDAAPKLENSDLQYLYSNYSRLTTSEQKLHTTPIATEDEGKSTGSSMVTMVEIKKLLKGHKGRNSQETPSPEETSRKMSKKSTLSSEVTVLAVKKLLHPSEEQEECVRCIRSERETSASSKSMWSQDDLKSVESDTDKSSLVTVMNFKREPIPSPSLIPFGGSRGERSSLGNMSNKSNASLRGHVSITSLCEKNEDFVSIPFLQRIKQDPEAHYEPDTKPLPEKYKEHDRLRAFKKQGSIQMDSEITLGDLNLPSDIKTGSMIVNYDKTSQSDIGFTIPMRSLESLASRIPMVHPSLNIILSQKAVIQEDSYEEKTCVGAQTQEGTDRQTQEDEETQRDIQAHDSKHSQLKRRPSQQ